MATETKNVKQSHDLANQGSGGHITSTGPCKTVKVQVESYRRWIADCRQVMTVLQHFVINRFDICRRRTTSLLAITSGKDKNAHNRACPINSKCNKV